MILGFALAARRVISDAQGLISVSETQISLGAAPEMALIIVRKKGGMESRYREETPALVVPSKEKIVQCYKPTQE